jgi:hypothetical protein
LKKYTTKGDTAVTLGDRKTTLKLDTAVTVPVSFTDSNGEVEEAIVTFMVMPSKRRDAIIGMLSLITDFGKMFLGMITAAVDGYGAVPTNAKQLSTMDTAVHEPEPSGPPPKGCVYPC